MKGLYFVAALMDPDTEHTVWDLKTRAATHGSVKGLKVLPHITEINPFKYSEEDEARLISQLSQLISSFSPTEINLNGFGFFTNPKSHTIYVAVEDSPELQEQHKQLNLLARYKLGFDPKNAPLKHTPHMTIAYRDLDRQKFEKTWPDFSQRKFEKKVPLESLWLLKHNGFCWIPYEEFAFKGFKNRLFD